MNDTTITAGTDALATLAALSPAVWATGIACAVLWATLHALHRRGRRPVTRVLFLLFRAAAAGFAGWVGLRVLASWIVLATPWPLWILGPMGGLGVEVLWALYAFERESLSRALGLGLTACRAAGLLCVLLLLAQPVRTWTVERVQERVVAVVIDDSASMRRPDFCLTRPEKLRLGRLLGVEIPLDTTALARCCATVDAATRATTAFDAWLDVGSRLAPALQNERFESHRTRFAGELEGVQTSLTEEVTSINTLLAPAFKLPAPLKRTVQVQRDRLVNLSGAKGIGGMVQVLRDTPKGKLPAQATALKGAAAGAAAGLNATHEALVALAAEIENALYYQLAEEVRGKIDKATHRTRLAVCDSVLAGTDLPGGGGMLPALSEGYTLRTFRFAASAAPVDYAAWQAAAQGGEAEGAAEYRATDIAGAVRKALEDVPRDKLAGVILLTDGRHNTPVKAASLTGRLRALRVPVNTVLVGGTQSPPDAEVSALEAPGTVQAGDRVVFKTRVRLQRMKGRTARVTLSHGEKTLAERDLAVPTPDFGTDIEFADTPTETGMREYAVTVQLFNDEVLTHNNAKRAHVAVVEHAATILLIEDRPRWEFRYLKNLFLREHTTLRMQHVLLRPDRIEGVPPPPVVHASASRPKEKTEATALPSGEQEWLKFDLIVLGDVSPQQLGPQGAAALRAFVAGKGGTLVVVAGENHMPRAYNGTPLAELFPVLTESTRPAKPADNRFPQGFTIARTAEGRSHVILQQDDRPDRDRAIWSRFPRMYWRLRVRDTRPGATVLAYAVPKTPPEFLRTEGAESGPAAEKAEALRRQFQRRNPLIVTQRYDKGRVLMLCFDRMWRLRYDLGDTHHHKFWGQVIRWASPEPLPAGTKRVRMGTDKREYRTGETVRVRATLAGADGKPVPDGAVRVSVFDGDKAVAEKTLQPVAWREGMYQCEIDGLEPGRRYRLALGGASVVKALAEERAKRTVETEVAFAPESSAETDELAASASFVSVLATASGGVVTDPASASEAAERLLAGTRTVAEQQRFPLWTWWPFFVVMLILFCVEWTARKKMGMP